jgi:hypothetical protein
VRAIVRACEFKGSGWRRSEPAGSWCGFDLRPSDIVEALNKRTGRDLPAGLNATHVRESTSWVLLGSLDLRARLPWAFARSRPERTRSRIIARSNSAKAPIISNSALPAGVENTREFRLGKWGFSTVELASSQSVRREGLNHR